MEVSWIYTGKKWRWTSEFVYSREFVSPAGKTYDLPTESYIRQDILIMTYLLKAIYVKISLLWFTDRKLYTLRYLYENRLKHKTWENALKKFRAQKLL